MILIGSRALAIVAPVALNRKPADFDFVCTENEARDWIARNRSKIQPTKEWASPKKLVVEGEANCEFEIVRAGTSSEMLADLASRGAIDTPFGLVPNVDMLFTLKRSHRHLKNSPHFWKTLADYHRLKALGAKVRPEYEEFLKLREKETYSYAHPKLNQSKKDFFAEEGQVKYTYDHDSIHEAVKSLDRPAYRFFQRDGSEVYCDKAKFFASPRQVQLLSVVEESAVLAIERSLVPHPGALSPQQAWRLAFSKVCTSISSGWWRAFAYEEALDCLRMYPADYVAKFQRGLDNGTVKAAI